MYLIHPVECWLSLFNPQPASTCPAKAIAAIRPRAAFMTIGLPLLLAFRLLTATPARLTFHGLGLGGAPVGE